MTKEWKQLEGQVIDGRFPLRRYLGGSEHSAVFLTERGAEHQKAAIKLVFTDPRNADLRLSLWEQTSKLSHPHLLRLYQAGRSQLGGSALVYVVSEYAEENLAEVVPQRPLSESEERDMLEPLLAVLAYVQSQGWVHGHIKPANVMAVAEQLKLSSDSLTRPAGIKGKLAGVYDAPEATNGTVSAEGDVWSLGMTIVETLTQRLPLWKKTEPGDPVLPSALPEPFRSIASHCLRRNPKERWTVAEIAKQFEPPSSARPPLVTEKTPAAFAKWGYMIPLVAACLVLAALAGPRLLNRGQEPQPVTAVTVQPAKVEPQAKTGPVGPESRPPVAVSSDSKTSPKAKTSAVAALRPVTAANLPSGHIVHGEVLQQVSPEVSQGALRTIQGTVRVRVKVAVDPSGSVTSATLDSPGPSKYFASRALQAARRWEFSPAEVDGRKVASEWLLRFEFARNSAKAFPMRATP